MKIAICDDDASENLNLKKLIYEYADDNKLDLSVSDFTSGTELLQQEKFDMYFLDFLMPEMNGNELAVKLIEKFGGSVTLCFLTSYESAAIQIINDNIQPVGFLTKPTNKEKLSEIFDKLQKKSFFSSVVLKKDGTVYILYPKDILYIEAKMRSVIVRCFDRSYEFHIPFHEIESYLPKNTFAKIQRSFIINLAYVTAFNKKSVTLAGGETLSISRNIDFDKIIEPFIFKNRMS